MRTVDHGKAAAGYDTQKKPVAHSGRGLELTPRLLARNTLLNLLGQGLPLLVAVATVPYLVHGMGTERFGLLSLAWVILGYFTVFDLGLGRATTKYVAELLGRGEEDRVPQVLWTSVVCQLALGLLGGFTLFLVTPLLVDRALRIPAELAGDARGTFAVLAVGLPFVLMSSSLFGALEAQQRFGLVNAVRAPASAGTYLLPVLGIALKVSLPGIVAFIVLWRALTTGFLLTANWGWLHGGGLTRPSWCLLRKLLNFGAWVTVSSVVSPVLVYLDRLLVAALVSVTAVGYYAAPYEAVTRLWILPASLVAVLFPAFSTLSGSGEREASGLLLLRSVRVVGATLAPVVLVIVIFAREIMAAWLGPTFGRESYRALQILAVGVLVNSVAHPPYAFVQAAGRPDLTAKFHLLELPLYVLGAFFLVREFGVIGAALAWASRVVLDMALLIAAAVRLSRAPRIKEFATRASITAVAFIGAGIACGKAKDWLAQGETATKLLLAALTLMFSSIVIWKIFLDEDERNVLLSCTRGA